MRRGEQSIDQRGKGAFVVRAILKKGVNFPGRGRQADKVEGRATNQCASIHKTHRFDATVGMGASEKTINLGARPVLRSNDGRREISTRLKRPVIGAPE